MRARIDNPISRGRCHRRSLGPLVGIDYYTLLARVRQGWSPEACLEKPVILTGGGKRTSHPENRIKRISSVVVDER